MEVIVIQDRGIPFLPTPDGRVGYRMDVRLQSALCAFSRKALGMAEYRRGAHTVFEIHLHLVWITKYRRPALQGEVATRVRDLIRDICGQHDVSILKGNVSKAH